MSYSHASISCIAESCSTIQMCYILLPYSSNGLDFLVIRTDAEVFVRKCLCGYIFNVLHLCVCLHVCECDVCACECGGQKLTLVFSSVTLHSIDWGRISYWTWNSPAWVNLSIRTVPELCCVCAFPAECWDHRWPPQPPGFCVDSKDPNSVLGWV